MLENLSLVIPVYNEEKRIKPTLEKILEFNRINNFASEIIIVDDGSNDGTSFILGLFQNIIKVITLPENHGKGYAIKRGMLAAGGENILFMDADLATPLFEITNICEKAKLSGADIVIGSRKHRGNTVKRTALRRFIGFVFEKTANFLLPLDFTDTQCGFKLFKKNAALDIFTKTKIERWSFDRELLFLAKKMNFNVEELPVSWEEKAGSKVQIWRDAFIMVRDLIKIRLYDLADAYEIANERKKSELPQIGFEETKNS